MTRTPAIAIAKLARTGKTVNSLPKVRGAALLAEVLVLLAAVFEDVPDPEELGDVDVDEAAEDDCVAVAVPGGSTVN